jgi:hypothetical protein
MHIIIRSSSNSSSNIPALDAAVVILFLPVVTPFKPCSL